MALLLYIDNEVPSFGEVDAVVTTGGGNVSQITGSLNGRGTKIVRVTNNPAGLAYLLKNTTMSIAYGETAHISFYTRVNSFPSAYGNTSMLLAFSSSSYITEIKLLTTGLRIYGRGDSGTISSFDYTITAGRVYYITLGVRRATAPGANDGWFGVYIDGQLINEWTNIDNDVLAADLDNVRIGQTNATGNAAYSADFDEIKIGTTLADVEPWRLTPSTDYIEAARTLVLYRQASADSVAFADYCVSELCIPIANLVPLPNASTNETLASYAAFQSEIETDLAAWLAANPTADAQKMCFLIGYGVPGYFSDGAVKVSAVSRLMRYGTAYSHGGAANPLASPASVARLTKADLDAAGITLATRIDSNSLINAEEILDSGLRVSDLTVLPDSDIFYGNYGDFISSLACQKLRMLASDNPATLTNAGAYYGSGGVSSLEDNGSRAVYVDIDAGSADELRSWTNPVYRALKSYDWASAVGWSQNADTFDADSFFEMLRIGGSFAEAAAVAVAKVDYTAVVAGEPFMTVSFPKQGHNIYKGTGGVESINFSSPLVCMRHDQDQAVLKTTLAAGQRHFYAARAVSTAGIEEKNTIVTTFIEVDEQGEALLPPLSGPFELSATAQTDGSLLVSFSHEVNDGEGKPTSFELLSDFGTGEINPNNPVGTLSDISTEQREFEILVTSATLPAMFAVRSMRDEQTSPLSETVFVQSWPSPQAPTLF